MQEVFILHHVHELTTGEEDIKLIGVYSTQQEAEDALNRVKDKPGFCDDIKGFTVNSYKLNRDGWTEGFFTYNHSEAYKEDVKEAGSDLLSEAFKFVEIATRLKNETNENKLINNKEAKEIDNDVYGIIRMILEDRLEGKEDYNISYEVTTNDSHNLSNKNPTLILKISKICNDSSANLEGFCSTDYPEDDDDQKT